MYKQIVNDKMVIMNFTEEYCKNEMEVLNSECFFKVFSAFVDSCVKHGKQDLIHLFNFFQNPKERFVDLFKLLCSFQYDEVSKISAIYSGVLKERHILYQLVEEFYNYWRRLERYSLIYAKKIDSGVQTNNFVDANREFTDVILKTYRTISENIYGHKFSIYRQLPAGVNASILLNKLKWAEKGSIYECLNDVQCIESIMIRPPFISYSKKNKRTGVYPETYTNPFDDVKLNANEYFCYPAFVGSSLAYVYFHRDFMAHGLAISNLFEFASWDKVEKKKPNLIYLFGYGDKESSFYYDNNEDIYVGIAPLSKDVDYFGYMKKMLLTLYNYKMIKEGNLPIHGACVNITLRSGVNKTLAIIGDSGAGKSETLEALAQTAGDDIINMRTIFDDMGTFKIENGKIKAYGTEIGAFVRLDDMSSDYAYKEMDRAIFMNPDKINARLVIPVSTYNSIMYGHEIDYLFYANNYEEEDEIKFFDKKDEALDVFKAGARKAKGTTGEVGLVKSFFANPFGPVQKEEETTVLLDQFFDNLFKNKVLVGQIYTKLAVDGHEQDGPLQMATKLFDLLKGDKNA